MDHVRGRAVGREAVAEIPKSIGDRAARCIREVHIEWFKPADWRSRELRLWEQSTRPANGHDHVTHRFGGQSNEIAKVPSRGRGKPYHQVGGTKSWQGEWRAGHKRKR